MTYSALPGFYVDTIRDGVDNTELKTRGNSALWFALRRSAMSASQHGWGFQDWLALANDPP
jgi:hypothetical protein